MKKIALLAALIMFCCTGNSLAHHAAASILDEEVYQMIDDLVADTPHADMVFIDPDSGMMEIDTTTSVGVENLIEDGLLTYAGMLDGDVEVIIEFGQGASVSLTIIQEE